MEMLKDMNEWRWKFLVQDNLCVKVVQVPSIDNYY